MEPEDTLRDTDPTDLRPEAVNFDTLVSEVQGQRLEVMALKDKLVEVLDKLDRIYDAVLNAISRVEIVERRVNQIETNCRYRHSNGHSHL